MHLPPMFFVESPQAPKVSLKFQPSWSHVLWELVRNGIGGGAGGGDGGLGGGVAGGVEGGVEGGGVVGGDEGGALGGASGGLEGGTGGADGHGGGGDGETTTQVPSSKEAVESKLTATGDMHPGVL